MVEVVIAETHRHNAHLVAAAKDPAVQMAATLHLGCAVVGSSSRLLGEWHGTTIDDHDVIIRMNDAPVRGYQDHVGSRTDVRFVNRWSVVSMHTSWPDSTVHEETETLDEASSQLLLWMPPNPVDNLAVLLLDLWRNATWTRRHVVRACFGSQTAKACMYMHTRTQR